MITEPIVLSAIVVGVVEIFKRLKLPELFIYPSALAVGVAIAILAKFETNVGNAILYGIALGLGGVGLYEGIKQIPGADKILKIS